jgi:hypothetical protein
MALLYDAATTNRSPHPDNSSKGENRHILTACTGKTSSSFKELSENIFSKVSLQSQPFFPRLFMLPL